MISVSHFPPEGVRQAASYSVANRGGKQSSSMAAEVARPWGGFQTPAFLPSVGAIKLLRVDPSQRLSLQRHAERSEHWVVLVGEVVATVDGVERLLRRGEHLEVPQDAWHRLANASDSVTAVLAEVQVGEYATATAAEEDIERSQDDYGRA